MITDVMVGLTFGIVGLAIISWLIAIVFEMKETSLGKLIFGMTSVIFAATPAKSDVDKSALPVKFSIERILPLILWLLIILPMFILPLILIAFPLLGLPWSYLMPIP